MLEKNPAWVYFVNMGLSRTILAIMQNLEGLRPNPLFPRSLNALSWGEG